MSYERLPDGRTPATARMPVVFVSHGSPLNVIEDNRWSRGFAALRDVVPRPRAILAVSAHWFVDGTYVTGNAEPPTIHDFSGFPHALYKIDYPARGDLNLARHVSRMLAHVPARLDSSWGLDHGTWSVLRWMYPEADIPVVQLSIDRRLDARRHLELGQALAALREDRVLILASGNVTHNLHDAYVRRQAQSADTPDWAARFDAAVAQAVGERDTERLLSLWPDSDDGRRSHPSPDHWFPLLYAYGAADRHDAVRFPIEGFDWGSLSMRNVVFG